MDRSDILLYSFIAFALITVVEFLALGFWKIYEFYGTNEWLFYGSIAPIVISVILFVLALKYA
ncbi:hypothetical protein DRN62_02880 [Nanoarchaeota archaeon]|nr:MAG: hypothetical protein DRN62_02880 [Nanoarchaeota archaeon]